MQWQPIETAPKDGRVLLVCWWRGKEGGEIFPACSAMWQDGIWQEVHSAWALEPVFEPTHWMPLPAPPA